MNLTSIKKNLEKKILETTSKISANFIALDSQKKNIVDATLSIIQALKKKKKIFFCGNGGSAADSMHLTAELIGHYLDKKRKSIRAICLNSNVSSITAIANDTNYENIFVRQLEGLADKGDVLFAITTSGKSKNVLKAIAYGQKRKLKVILLTSINFKGTKNKIDNVIRVPSKRVDRIQEMHIAVGHMICEQIEKNLK